MAGARHLGPKNLVVHEIGKEALHHPVGETIDILHHLRTIATHSAGALLPTVGTTRLLLVGQDTTTTIVDLLPCAIAGVEVALLLPIIPKEEYLPVVGSAIEV